MGIISTLLARRCKHLEGFHLSNKNLWTCKLTKMRNDLKPAETTRNQLKPPRNYLKPAYCSIFLLKISYSQVRFALILHAIVFLGQIWSHKLKFSKLTEMWYRHTLLYPYFEFNVLFSKFLTFIFFWANLVPKSEVL